MIIDFDENKSLFAVYDGHGGSEVAVYTSQHLPEFIKKTAEFKKGNYKQALIDAFMEFDESLIKDEVMAILKTLKKESKLLSFQQYIKHSIDNLKIIHTIFTCYKMKCLICFCNPIVLYVSFNLTLLNIIDWVNLNRL